MNKLFKFRYPKLVGFGIAIILAYITFSNPLVSSSISHLGELSYFGTFIAGIFYTFGFSSPFSAGFFIDLNPSSIFFSGIIGGLGALIGDIFIFSLIRFSFEDEFKRLRNSKAITRITRLIERSLGHKIRVYLMYAFAGILIASPLPDEAGVTMLAGLTKISAKSLAIVSFLLNTLGIIILMLI
jgi:uncharacterized membrane protein YdjX (TVP38/TMEM64 family)